MSAKEKQTVEDLDPVFAKYGEPFLAISKGKVSLNERAVAVKCATDHLVKYNPTTKTYERFDARLGLWMTVHEVEVFRLLDDLLLKLGTEYEKEEFVRTCKASQLKSLSRMLQPYQAPIDVGETKGLVHVSNGVLELRGATPKLLKHDPKFGFRVSSGINYDAKAKCPQFLGQLLEPALEKADIVLVQKYCGSMLLGENTCHGILVIRGTPGGGKSTLVSVIEKVIGETNVAHLLTKHLTGRFETSAFIGKRLLVGKDVPGDMLSEKGARMLKSLVGGDLLQAEIKYNPTKQTIRGNYHVIIASNNRLKIALDGDDEAWGRRLLVVDFDKQKPTKAIPNFADKLFREEAPGILNWLVQGALDYRSEMKKGGKLALDEVQQRRVNSLLQDSDSVQAFVDERLAKKDGEDVSSEELLLGYYGMCKKRKWRPVGRHAFQLRMPDILLEKFGMCRRNDIQRKEGAVRGFKNLAWS